MAVTNDEELPKDYSKEYMYDCFKVKGQDQCFVCLICLLMRFFIIDVLAASKKENMKAISENPFYQVLTAIRDKAGLSNSLIMSSIKELSRQFTLLTSFHINIEHIDFNEDLTIENKLAFIIQLLQNIDETNTFHDIASRRAEDIQGLVDMKIKQTEIIK